jgi:hypothetical protein
MVEASYLLLISLYMFKLKIISAINSALARQPGPKARFKLDPSAALATLTRASRALTAMEHPVKCRHSVITG